MRWRFLLAIVVVSGLLLLRRVDALLERESQRDARAQALQAGALIESFVGQRVDFLGTLAALTGAAHSTRDQTDRFTVVAEQIRRQMPDIASVYLLNERGVVRAASGATVTRGEAHRAFPLRAPAMQRAAAARSAAATAPLRLDDGQRGTLLYVPLVDDGRVTGYVAGAFAYGRLFSEALAGKLRGHFPYRVLDENGQQIVASEGYPERAAGTVSHAIVLPGDHRWRLEVAAARSAPAPARVVNWITGALVILLVSFLALREELRARRFAAYSHDLELLSRHLLDANMRLEDRAQQIAEANRAKSRFLANVSHELRTPLTSIRSFAELLLAYEDDPQVQKEFLRIISTESERLTRLVNDVLDISRIEAGHMAWKMDGINVAELVRDLATTFTPLIDLAHLTFDTDIAADLGTVYGDRDRLHQVISNLLNNATKFTRSGGAILLRAVRVDAEIRIAVTDTGIGIDVCDQERIFEKFQQVGDTLTDKPRGTGLGLAICRDIVEHHQGRLWVDSKPGVGSTFTVALPLQDELAAAA